MGEGISIGGRVREARKRRGLTQQDLAASSGISLSLITKLERDEYESTRLETVRKLAVALGVPTSALADGPDAPAPDVDSAGLWEPVRRALNQDQDGEPGEEPTRSDVKAGLDRTVPLLLASRFTQIRLTLPDLLRSADALVAATAGSGQLAARSLRAQIRQVTGAVMLHAWQFDTAERAFDMAMSDASDPLTAMSVVEERCWGLIRQGRLTETRELAFRWADQAEPKMSTATPAQLAAWGRLLMRAAAAAIRDNRPGEATDALRLVTMAGNGTGRDFTLPHSPWHMFGPVTASVAAAEHAAVSGQPQVVLTIAGQLVGSKRRVHTFSPSHRLDVAGAHVTLRQYPDAIAVLQELRQARPEWLPQQRHASDILTAIITRRRTLTPDMRDLAAFMRLPL